LSPPDAPEPDARAAAVNRLTIVSVAVVLIAIAELAIFAPARRAAAVDPAQALRAE
jgi:ABC-type lipoprotein release transport system permease subunit